MNRFAPKQRTLTDIHNEMIMLLVNATPQAFARLTLDELCRKYSRLRPGVIEAELVAETARRKAVGEAA